MRAKFLARLMVAVSLADLAASASATTSMSCATTKKTAHVCRVNDCERLFEDNLAACAELPSNKSCPVMAKEQKRQCDQYCDDAYPKQIDAEAGCTDK
jgi:hypothetical protein